MIIARLTPKTDPAGRKYLVGRTTSAWPLQVGVLVVLRKERDGSYALLELGPRSGTVPTREGLASFLEDVE
jgi:hypothetical protein